MSHNWLQTTAEYNRVWAARWLYNFRRNLGIPGLHISTDKPDSCQHRTQRFPGTRLKRCWYCSPMYRGRHRARTTR